MLRLPKNKVAVTPIYDPDTTPSGRIIIPDQAKERCDQGIVKYLGPECKWIKQGMYVLFGGYTGQLIHLEGEGKLIIMPEDFVVAEIGEVDNIQVPGLYFRQKFNREQAKEELIAVLSNYHSSRAEDMADYLLKHGIYGPVASPYFEADYENIFEYMSEAFRESTWYRGIVVKPHKPTVEDYENLGGEG